MRYKELTKEDKETFLKIYNQDKTKKKIVKELISEFDISERSVYYFHEKITEEIYSNDDTVDINDLETNEIGDLVIKEKSLYTEEDIEHILKENKKMRKSLTIQRDNNNLYRKEVRVDARVENMYNVLDDIVRSYKPPVHNISVRKRAHNTDSNIKPFIMLSDVHYNEVTQGKYIENINEFNNEICLKGIEKVFYEASKIEGEVLRVYLLGDIISGIIHDLDFKGQVPVTQSIIELASYLSNIINEYSRQYKHIKINMLNGNHSRLSGKPTLSLKAFDFEHLLFELIKNSIKADNVTTYYSLSGHLVDNVGTEDKPVYNLCFHGDNKSFNPTTDGTVLKQLNIGDELFNVKIHHTMSGHTHKPVFAPNFRGGVCMVNGCVSGSSEYGVNANFLPLHPYQWIGAFSEDGKELSEMKCVKIR